MIYHRDTPYILIYIYRKSVREREICKTKSMNGFMPGGIEEWKEKKESFGKYRIYFPTIKWRPVRGTIFNIYPRVNLCRTRGVKRKICILRTGCFLISFSRHFLGRYSSFLPLHFYSLHIRYEIHIQGRTNKTSNRFENYFRFAFVNLCTTHNG